jgi:cytochrome c5
MTNIQEHVEETAHASEGFIKTPRQLIITVILAFVVPITVIGLLVSLVTSGAQVGSGSDALTPEGIATRIKPVAGFSLVDASAPKELKTGQQVFDTTCSACHTSGAAGAPKIGDSAAWAPFIKAGYEDMVKNAIHGIGAMPPKGGNPSLDDLEVERAGVYIANKSGAAFEEPKAAAKGGEQAKAEGAAPAAAAPAAAAPAAPTVAAATPTPAPAPSPAAEAPKSEAAPEAAAPAAETASIDPAGEKLYKSVCFACHDTGAAGAPKHGDKAAWAPFVATGLDTMVQNAIHGVGAMPPRGGSQATDAEMKAAVQYIMEAVK